MRIALFDWTEGGHHALYLRRVAEALASDHDVIAGVPDVVADALAGAPVAVERLGPARPPIDWDAPLARQHRAHGAAEVGLLERFVAQARPDHVLHLYGDPVLRHLVRRPPLAVPLSIIVFFPRAHYPSRLSTPLSPKERGRALFQRELLRRWRRRRDAHALFMLDEVAVEVWGRRRGAAVRWFPEPPVATVERPSGQPRRGCVLYGSLAARKGIERLAAAVAGHDASAPVVLAGAVEPGYEGRLARIADDLRAAGVELDLRDRRHTEAEGLAALAAARCAVLPYPRHYGMSRVLVEAATVGTPVVVHDHGLLAHLVRRYRIGEVVNCADPVALGCALARVAGEDEVRRRAAALAAFAQRYDAAAFRAALLGAFPSSDAGAVRPHRTPRGLEPAHGGEAA